MNTLRGFSSAARMLGPAGRGLWQAVYAGPDEPPVPLQRWGRAGDWVVWILLLLLLLPAAVIVMLTSRSLSLTMGGAWWPLVMVLSLALLALAAFRPLRAWRLAWLALVFELVSGWDANAAGVLPPLFVSEVQLLVFLMVLFLASASQPLRVVGWVWAFTAGLVWLVPMAWSLDLAMVVQRVVPMEQVEWFLGSNGWRVDPSAPSWFQLATVGVVTLVVLAGQAARRASRTKAALAVAQEGRLVLAERARIARELHDVVAHHMSMVAVRAETAPYRLDLASVPPPAAAEFRQISQEARAAMAELRRLLGVLRSDEVTPPPTTPQPSLSDLADLLEPVRAAGAGVSVEMHGALNNLSPAVDLCAYRIVQEALSNSARHAVGAPIRITLRRTGAELVVAVSNGPAEPAEADRRPSDGHGHGVRGMRERVAMLGGTLQAGPTTDGGYEVVATLPLRQPVGQPS